MANEKAPTGGKKAKAKIVGKKTAAQSRTTGHGKQPRQKATGLDRSDAALRKGEDQYQDLFRDAVLGIFHSTLEGRFIDVNPALARMMGYDSPGQVLSSVINIAGQVYADPPKRDAVAKQALEAGGTITAENRYLRKDGAIWHGLLHLRIVKDKQGKPGHYEGFIEDITERKRIEAELRTARSDMDLFFSVVPDLLSIASTDGYFKLLNREWEKTLGFTLPELLSRPFDTWIHPDDVAQTYAAVKRQMEGEPVVSFSNRYRCKDGSYRWLEWNVTPAYGTQMYAAARDITERKKLEDARMFLVECGTKGDDFFESLSRYLAGSLDMDYICIDRLEGDLLIARTVAVYCDGTFEDNVSYTLRDTPCGEAVGKDVCCFPEGVRHRFPKDVVLRDMKAESYVGVTLWSHTHQPIGLIAAIGRRPLADKNLAESILKLAAIRAAAELERKLAEEALRSINESYRVLFDQDPLPGWIYDTETFGFLLVNKAAQAHYGYTMAEFSAMTIKDIRPRKDVEKLLSFSAKISDKPAVSSSWKHRKKDGSLIDVEIHSHPITFNGRKARRVIVHDITERIQAEEQIRQSEQFIRNILDTVDEGFLVIDRDYRIITANKAYCGQVERPCDDVIGKHCYEVSHKKHQPCFAEGEDCAVRQVFETGTPHTVTHQHQDLHGGIVFVESKCFPIKDGAGAVTSVIETINNITERHLLEEERLKIQKLESIGTLAGGIAHDFNNLLQGVFGYISMAKMTYDQKDKSLAMLEQAENALHQSVDLTTQLLTFSKGGKPVKKPTSLKPVVENAVKFALSGSRSTYRIDLEPSLWHTNADAGQLGQVIQNIVLNADQAMPLGGVVKITARNVPANDALLPATLAQGNYISLAIEDSGVGIQEQYLDKIFDPYFTTKEKGSGLGLATSYSIIRNHEGLIRVASTVGKGTVFSLFIPAMTGSAGPGMAEPSALPVFLSARILVMDDEELIRNLASELLRVLGHNVEVAAHGEEAVAKYQAALASGRPFDIVILDLTIRGGMGGAETIKRLRELDPGVRAIVSSGYSEDTVIADHVKHGFKAFLKKPYNVNELRSVLNSLLSQ